MFRNITLWGHCYAAVLPLDSLHQFLKCQREKSDLAFTAISLCRVMECEVVGIWIHFSLGLRHQAPALVQPSSLFGLIGGFWLSSWWELSSPGPLLYLEPRWDTYQCLSRKAKGQMDLQALGAPWPLHMVRPDWNPELRQLQGRGCAATAKQVLQLILLLESLFFAAVSEHSCWFPILKEAVRLPFPAWCTQSPCSRAGAMAGSPKQIVVFHTSLHHCLRQTHQMT